MAANRTNWFRRSTSSIMLWVSGVFFAMLELARCVCGFFSRNNTTFNFLTFLSIGLGTFAFVIVAVDHQLGVILYKVSVVTIGGLLGFCLDAGLFNKKGELRDVDTPMERSAIFIRRGMMCSAGMVAMAMAM